MVIGSTNIPEAQRKEMKSVYENRNIRQISQMNLMQGYVKDFDFTVIAYVLFDDSEHKTENGEYVIGGFHHD